MESNKVIVIPPHGRSVWYVDVDFVEDPDTGYWYKIGARKCVYDGDRESSFSKLRLIDQDSILRIVKSADKESQSASN